MNKPGPSREYRDLLKEKITPEQYVEKLKRDAGERLGIEPVPAIRKRDGQLGRFGHHNSR